MKYYLIFKHTGSPHTKSIYPSYIVERESTAINFCKEYSEFYYEEREDGHYILATSGLSTIGDSIELAKPADINTPTFKTLENNIYDVNPLSKGLFDDIKCPHCGASYFQVGRSSSTAMYCPTIVKDGKVVSKDRNIYTTEYYCLECGKTFKVVNGEVKR